MMMAAHAANISLKEQGITTIRTIFPTIYEQNQNSRRQKQVPYRGSTILERPVNITPM
jgi:hypothetical protein